MGVLPESMDWLGEDPLRLICTHVAAEGPAALACLRGTSTQLLTAADEPQLWIQLYLPTESRRNRLLMSQCCHKVAKETLEHASHELPRATIVVQGVSRGVGATVLCDALSSEGVGFVSLSELQDSVYQNDLIVRSFAAEVERVPWWFVTNDRRTTAMASPFAAALYSGDHTMLLLVLALNRPSSEQFMAAEAALKHIKQHVQTSIPMAVVGIKSASVPRHITPHAAWKFASAHHLPYVECDARSEDGARDVFLLACTMA